MNKPKKQVLSYDELLKKVQGILVCYPECENIHIDGIQVYKEQTDGANWHINTFRRSGDDNDMQECKEKIIDEIRSLRSSFDVVEEYNA